MDWLTGNGVWVLLAIAAAWIFMRRGGLRGLGMGGHHGSSHRGHGHDEHGGPARPTAENRPAVADAALDPVSGNPVRTDKALTAVFGGRAYYFESDDTRRRFEAEPQKYAAAAPPQAEADRPRRRRGC